MKYIRTKDTIFKVVEETDIIYKVVAKNKKNIYSKSKCQTYVLESADTIEELCDEFVCERPSGETYILDKPFNLKAQQKYIGEIFGTIWTNKGLIYVAKMNDNGELELL